MTSGEMLIAGLHVSSLAVGGFAAVARPAAPGAENAVVTEMPSPRLYQLGRCVPCKGRWTLVAPGLFYFRGDGQYVSIPACADHHEAFVMHVHKTALRATLPSKGEGWE
ncbi:hypothetical protein P3T27_002132 [Kitasatospora sp. MAA19]|nr:hypothetical protein [Kitasatospora sp. MAA19]